MVVKTYNSYVADELANKVYHLALALNEAKRIIEKLEEENKHLLELIEPKQLEDVVL